MARSNTKPLINNNAAAYDEPLLTLTMQAGIKNNAAVLTPSASFVAVDLAVSDVAELN